ncbi:hypothetical protein ACOSP7_025946 [Xanthoceras sorbifolium]|uniref:Uncharacterized protein n=1 Tax=Xanthoceras sorbifolium TaxID=99658 RepID=A0ABQ8H5X1_9ROSI|nr:hypothetical protein JRO89_XS13G0014500 [Xanthoceras sorbifolium]
MEAGKRKRSERESEERLTKKKKEEIATDAEVEEFFAILRRMQVAVKYFGEGWRTAVEKEAAPAAVDKDDNDQEVKRDETAAAEEENINILDLNAEPKGESHVASA